MLAPVLALPLLLVPPAAVDATVPRTGETIAIDGVLDEPAWATAIVLEDFLASSPVEMRAPSQPTRVRILRDDRRLYVAFEAFDAEPAAIRATLADRDAIFADDVVGVVLDPFQDRRRAFIFLANPFGAQADCVNVEGGFGDDCSWDALWSSVGRVGPAGYTVEIAIPFSSIRFDRRRDAWGFQLVRLIPRVGEQVTLPERRAALGHPLKQMGTLRGMRGIQARAALAVIPEITLGMGPDAHAGEHLLEEGERGADDAVSGDAGINAKLSWANVAADAAINPDFSQVESDAARISFNQRFALYYDEKRPFFLEGRELFVMPWEVVYTRSIVDPLYGVKVSGKSGPTAFAVLHAVDESPAPSTVDARWAPGSFRGEPAVTTIARVASDVAANATLGMIVTDKHVANAWNRLGGIDASWTPRSDIRFATQVLASATDHPDGAYETGDVAKLRFFRYGRHFNWFSWYEQVSSGFRAESGFLFRTGYREVGAEPSLRIETGRKTGLIAINIGSGLRALDETVRGGRERAADLSVSLRFPASYLAAGAAHSSERFLGEDFEWRRMDARAGTAPWKWLDVSASFEAGGAIAYFAADPYLGGFASGTASLALKPSQRLSLSASVTRDVFSAGGTSDALRQFADRSGEEEAFDGTVARLSSQLFFTRSISLRAIGDWDGVSKVAASSLLLAWRPGPGTIVYAGWQDAYATRPGDPRPAGRALFLKLSYLFGTS